MGQVKKITSDERMEAWLEEATEESLQRFVDLATFTLRRLKRLRAQAESVIDKKAQPTLPGVE
jgi:hypothetical protein